MGVLQLDAQTAQLLVGLGEALVDLLALGDQFHDAIDVEAGEDGLDIGALASEEGVDLGGRFLEELCGVAQLGFEE